MEGGREGGRWRGIDGVREGGGGIRDGATCAGEGVEAAESCSQELE